MCFFIVPFFLVLKKKNSSWTAPQFILIHSCIILTSFGLCSNKQINTNSKYLSLSYHFIPKSLPLPAVFIFIKPPFQGIQRKHLARKRQSLFCFLLFNVTNSKYLHFKCKPVSGAVCLVREKYGRWGNVEPLEIW